MGLFSAPLPAFFGGKATVLGLASEVVVIVINVGALRVGWEDRGPASRDLERMKEPGSPTSGLSSMYSFP